MITVLIKWLLLALSSILITLFAVVAAPALALFRQPDDRFPAWLSWFQTPDAPCCGDELVSNTPLHNGWVFRKMVIGNVTYWQFYFVHGWTNTRCLRVNLGWKLWGDLQVGQVRSLVISANPWIKCEVAA